jgi:hypothetical protein
MRASYKMSQRFLTTTLPPGPTQEEWEVIVGKYFLIMAGFSEAELEEKGYLEISLDEQIILAEKRKKDTSNEIPVVVQKNIPLDEVAKHLENGWEFVRELSNKTVIMQSVG